MHGSYMIKRIVSFAAAALVSVSIPLDTAAEQENDGLFFDDFIGNCLDREKWLIAEKNWGGIVNENGKTVDYNGGVLAENVDVSGGDLVLTGLGNNYRGELRGINRDGTYRADGKRCGGAIDTKDYFGSGSYEIRAKIAPELGCCSAMWTFEYEELYSDDTLKIVNHEIDIEFPGRDKNDELSLSHALCTTWETEDDYKSESVECGDQTDGEFHTYRFDWHTGSDTEKTRVEYYFDDVLTYTSYKHIPTNESRFWLGLWFPKNWAGDPDFEQTGFEVDYVRITPFHESGDTPQHETYGDSGWSKKADVPKGWLLWHSYSSYSANDSKLYLRSPDGVTKTISGDFVNAMNGNFGTSPDLITFMAIDESADEWDIFVCDNGKIENLTVNSGFRNEDPKWSPDGKNIVFKRGHWDSGADDFVYDLALINVATRKVTMLTNDSTEEAMPCFSDDGKYVYYASYTDRLGSICRLEISTGKTETVYEENGVSAYYPIFSDGQIYFTKWYSADERYDQIIRIDGDLKTALPFNLNTCDCSDACPIKGDQIIFSSTINGDYDLFFYDGSDRYEFSELNTANEELGADFFPYEEDGSVKGDVDKNGLLTVADLVLFENWLISRPGAELKDPQAADLCKDGTLDVFDLCVMRKEILKKL